MTARAGTLTYPPEGFGAPKDRKGHATGSVGLPAGTEVFSADNHISLSEDIFYEQFPASMKEQAPRVVREDGAWTLAIGGKTFLPREFTAVLQQYDPLAGAATNDVEARMRELESDGIHRELAFPNALLGLMGWPDKEVRELCFRIYNEHIAELQERSNGRFYGVGIAELVGRRRLPPHADRDEGRLGLTTFWMPLKPGAGDDGKPIDYNGPAMYPVWEAIEESGLPGGAPHRRGAVGRRRVATTASWSGWCTTRRRSARCSGATCSAASSTATRACASAGSRAASTGSRPPCRTPSTCTRRCSTWPTTAIEHEVEHYWREHMYASFMVDPLGLEMIDRIGVDRVMWSSDYPHNESTFGYSEQSLASVVERRRPRGGGQDGEHQRADLPRSRSLMAAVVARVDHRLDLPSPPDLARMRRDRDARLRSVMAEQGRRRPDPAGQRQRVLRRPGRPGP